RVHHAGFHGHRRLVDEPRRSAVRGPQALYPHGHGRSQPRRAPAAHLPLPALSPPPARPDGSSAHAPALASLHQVGGALGDRPRPVNNGGRASARPTSSGRLRRPSADLALVVPHLWSGPTSPASSARARRIRGG